jgi:hypothetical protein
LSRSCKNSAHPSNQQGAQARRPQILHLLVGCAAILAGSGLLEGRC